MVFDESPQTQLSPLIPSTSDVTVTILDEDDLEEDPEKTITPADFYGDDDTLSVCASPIFCERLGFLGCAMTDRFCQLRSRLSLATVRL